MKFRAGDLEFNATVAEASESPSPRTGAPLRWMTIQFRAQKATMHEQALEQATQRQSGGLYSLSDANQPDAEWRVRESTSTYVGSEPWGINHHVWRIEQVERLACERLILGSLDLEPYEYAEDATDESVLRLAARAFVSDVDLDALSRISDRGVPIEVVRVGISATPRRMLLRGYVWGEAPDGLAVVLSCTDEHEPRVTLDGVDAPPPPDVSDVLKDLWTILAAKGVVDEQDWRDLGELVRERRHAARRVSNVDSWSL